MIDVSGEGGRQAGVEDCSLFLVDFDERGFSLTSGLSSQPAFSRRQRQVQNS